MTVVDRAVVPLEPWTVYGRLVSVPDGSGTTIEVLDIGFLPPAGCYAGSLDVEGRRVPVVFTVPARSPAADAVHRSLRLEVEPSLALPSGCQAALTVRGLMP